MNIAIIGAGRVGTTLGARWNAIGHDIVYGVRDPNDPRHAALGHVTTPADAVRRADVVVVSLPWNSVEAVLRAIDVGDAVVIDATNPLAADARQLDGLPQLAGAQLVAEWVHSALVVKAFNTTGAANMADPAYPGTTPAMFIAGDDERAKATVAALAREIGFDAIDSGPLAAARDLEHLAMIWIRLAHTLNNGPDIAFALHRR